MNGINKEFVIIEVVPNGADEGWIRRVANPAPSVTISDWILLLKVASGNVKSLGISVFSFDIEKSDFR